MNTDYLCENKLKERNPELHKRFRESVFGIQGLLNRHKYIFPTYTDHTALHSLEVIDFCNALIGPKRFVMKVDTSDQNVFEAVLELREKLKETLTECRLVTAERTGYTISQEDIVIVPM